MAFQGHIENGVVVFDEPVPLPNGTVVRIEPITPRAEEADSAERPLADTDKSYTVEQMARAWRALTKPIAESDVQLTVDPDDYPLF